MKQSLFCYMCSWARYVANSRARALNHHTYIVVECAFAVMVGISGSVKFVHHMRPSSNSLQYFRIYPIPIGRGWMRRQHKSNGTFQIFTTYIWSEKHKRHVCVQIGSLRTQDIIHEINKVENRLNEAHCFPIFGVATPQRLSTFSFIGIRRIYVCIYIAGKLFGF